MSLLALNHWLEHAASALRAWRLRALGVQLGDGCRIGHNARLVRTWRGGGRGALALGNSCDVRDFALLETWGGHIHLGRHVFVGPHAVIYGHGGVDVGDDTLISMHTCIVSSNHALPDCSHAIRSKPDELRPTQIGRDVWLGARVVVLGGVIIGDGCVVGAGSVVTKSLPPGAIAFGTPATVRGWRNGACAT